MGRESVEPPLVSVVMSVLNEERYVRSAIESILNQTYERLELIVIDDYSTDRSVDICRSIRDPRIRIHVKTTEPKRLAASRNIGVRMARGEYVALQDADDVSEPTRIESQLAKAEQSPDRRVVGTGISRVEGNRVRTILPPERHEDIIKGFQRSYNRTTIVSGTILASRKIFQDYPYRVRFRYMQDWDHMLRLYEGGRVEFCNCQQPLYTYVIRAKSSIFREEWLDYNIYVRNSQHRRKRGLDEFPTLEAFLADLAGHPLERSKWIGLRALISMKKRLSMKASPERSPTTPVRMPEGNHDASA